MTGKRTLLLVDNDPDFLASRSKRLQDDGFEVVTASSPEEAKAKLKKLRIDVAILDVRLRDDHDPDDVSGIELAGEISGDVVKIIMTRSLTSDRVISVLQERRGGRKGTVATVIIKEDPKAPRGQRQADLRQGARSRKSKRPIVLQPGREYEELKRAIEEYLLPSVFVVHGHDPAARLLVEKFIERVGLKPVILQDLPGGGRTIIEQIEFHSDVDFAVVLLTPDDVGRSREEKKLRNRVRQNVVLELGYFLAKLGRGRTVGLYKPTDKIELPSDYGGVLFVEMDRGGGWQVKLGHELRAAGLKVDLNAI
jgi:predicted nucleotide-binding protein